VLWTVGSTNSLLLEANNVSPGMLRVLLAENQLAGRGRRGRSWQAPLGGGLCLSLGFGVDALPRDFGGLTLVIGLAVLAALRAAGARNLALKWPNDIVRGPCKIAGILTELRAEAGGPAWVVCGIGINVRLPSDAAAAMASAGVHAGDLASLGLRDDRNQIAARVIDQCADDIAQFLAHGLAAFQQRWRQNDALSGKRVHVEQAGVSIEGIASGIDAGGALQLLTDKGLTSIIAGDVSVRPTQEAAR
jgi:BirA family transcriptional regulator, biotin operon repressor / biotin---[acetyl-CoA-carboxylase] ligase